MSTRCTTHFFSGNDERPTSIVYRHSDGYPDGAGSDILAFIDELHANVKDNRLDDPCYLAAKYVVFLARMFNIGYQGSGMYAVNESPLDFLSVGICMEDPGDIEYRYEIRCQGHNEKPLVKCFKMIPGPPPDYNRTKGRAVKIPAPSENLKRDLALKTSMATAMELPQEV